MADVYKYPAQKIAERAPIVPILFLLTGVIIAFFFLIGYTQPFAQEDPATACETSIYNERCNAALYCEDKMNTNFQCRAHCSRTENFFDDICIRATCANGSPWHDTSACRCVNLVDYEREDYETCQKIMCEEGACLTNKLLYEITSQLYPSQLLAMAPMKTSVLGYFNGDPSSTAFINTGVPYTNAGLTCISLQEYERQLNARVVPGDPEYPLWRFKESVRYPFHFWIIWGPYQRFILSGDTKTLLIKDIRNYAYVNDTPEDNEDGLPYEDLFQVEVVQNMGLDGLICHIKNKYGYLTNYDFKLTNDVFTGSDNQRWVISQKPTVYLKDIISSANVEDLADSIPTSGKNTMLAISVNLDTGSSQEGKIILEKNNPAISFVPTGNSTDDAYFWGQMKTGTKEVGQIRLFEGNFYTRGSSDGYRIIDGKGNSDNSDYNVKNGSWLYKESTEEIPTNQDTALQVTPNLDWTANDNPSFALRAQENMALYVGRPCRDGEHLCWTPVSRLYTIRYADV